MDTARRHLHTSVAELRQHSLAAVTAERAYLLPHHALRQYISHYTVYLPLNTAPNMPPNTASPQELTVIPDASVAIVCCIQAHGVELRLWGPSSQASVVENNPQKIPLYVMVEFFPGGASALFDFPLSILHNSVSSLANFDSSLSRCIAEQVEKHLAASAFTGLDAFCSALDQVFLKRLERSELSALPLHIVGALQRTKGGLRIEALARQCGYSERHLARLLLAKSGMGAKRLARVFRINAACLAMRSPSLSLTELAHALHYHDQAHFIHDFKAVCGLAPGEYRQKMSVFYNEELKFGASFPEKEDKESPQ